MKLSAPWRWKGRRTVKISIHIGTDEFSFEGPETLEQLRPDIQQFYRERATPGHAQVKVIWGPVNEQPQK